MFSLFVSLTVRPEHVDRFLEAVEAQATASLANEPGCLRFDVCADEADPNHFLLYETYLDAAAFDAHRETPHFVTWRRAVDAYVERQVNTRTELLFTSPVAAP
jgi:autoinducer 2-degrading protein